MDSSGGGGDGERAGSGISITRRCEDVTSARFFKGGVYVR